MLLFCVGARSSVPLTSGCALGNRLLFINIIDSACSASAEPAADEELREEQLSVASQPGLGEVPQGDRAEQRAEGVRDDLHESAVLGELRRYSVDTQSRHAVQRAARRRHPQTSEDGKAHPADGGAAAVHRAPARLQGRSERRGDVPVPARILPQHTRQVAERDAAALRCQSRRRRRHRSARLVPAVQDEAELGWKASRGGEMDEKPSGGLLKLILLHF